jgi:hypothetical protein
MRWHRRLRALAPADRRLAVEAWVRLLVVSLVLRYLGYRYVARWVTVCDERAVTHLERVRAERYARWIAVAAPRQPVQAECLAQSLTLLTWLRREGVPCALQIGVAKVGAELGAHAWIELDGVPVNDTPRAVADFARLAGVQRPGTPLDGRLPPGAAALLR